MRVRGAAPLLPRGHQSAELPVKTCHPLVKGNTSKLVCRRRLNQGINMMEEPRSEGKLYVQRARRMRKKCSTTSKIFVTGRGMMVANEEVKNIKHDL